MSDWLLDVDARVIDAIKYAKQRGFCATGDAVIVVTGWVNLFSSFSIHFLFDFSVRVMVQQIPYVLFTLIRFSHDHRHVFDYN
jgi:hypothetical protein